MFSLTPDVLQILVDNRYATVKKALKSPCMTFVTLFNG